MILVMAIMKSYGHKIMAASMALLRVQVAVAVQLRVDDQIRYGADTGKRLWALLAGSASGRVQAGAVDSAEQLLAGLAVQDQVAHPVEAAGVFHGPQPGL